MITLLGEIPTILEDPVWESLMYSTIWLPSALQQNLLIGHQFTLTFLRGTAVVNG